MISRRGFLGTLMASIVGTAFVPKDLLWVPAPEASLPIAAPQALLTLEAITREAARRLAARIALPVTRIGDLQGHRLGDRGMTGQLGVDLAAPRDLDAHGLDAERYIEPAVACLAAAIQNKRWATFGELALPLGCARAARVTGDGVSVRGVMVYDLDYDRTLLRLDVIGGAA